MFAGRSALPSPFAVILSLVVGITALLLPVRADDTWWHLRAGEEVLRGGHLLTQNTFSFTAPRWPWLMHEWLSEVVLAAAQHAGGGPGLVMLAVLLNALTVTLAWRLLTREGDTGWAAAAAALYTAVLLLPSFSLRPWLFTNACFAGLLLVESSAWRLERRAGAVVLLFCAWANLHGSFLAGLLALGALFAGAVAERGNVRERLLLGVSAVLGALCTPTPLERLFHPLQYALGSLAGQNGYLKDVMRQNLEWQPPTLGSPLWWMLVLLLLGCTAVVHLSGKRPTAGAVAVLAVFAAMAFSSLRNIPLAAIAAAPLLGRHLPSAVQRLRRDRQATPPLTSHAPAPVLVSLACAWLLWTALPGKSDLAALSPEYFPTALLEQLRLHRPARPFNHYDYGGAFQWALWPGVRPFWDQRVDCYPPEVIRDGLALHNATDGWQQLLAHWEIDAVAYKQDTALARVLRQDGSWRVAWEDEQSVLFLPTGR